MKIICWNIQKLNKTKALDRRHDIARVVAAAANGEPFILFVLEAQHNDRDLSGVARYIGHALKEAPYNIHNKYGTVYLGGSPHRREDIVVVAGNGADVSNCGAFKDWHEEFKLRCKDQVKLAQELEEKRQKKIEHLRKTVQREILATRYEKLEALPPTDFRNPAFFVITDGTWKYWTVLVVHSPGPADGENLSKINYAQQYNKAVFSAAHRFQRFHIVMGDFNQVGEITTNLVDHTKGSGGTTKTLAGTRSIHRYDRVFSNIAVQVAVGWDDMLDLTLTDHLFTITTVR